MEETRDVCDPPKKWLEAGPPPKLWIQQIPESITQEHIATRSDGNRQAGEGRDPPLGGNEDLSLRDHQAPFGHGCRKIAPPKVLY